jgi:hypothetical protein
VFSVCCRAQTSAHLTSCAPRTPTLPHGLQQSSLTHTSGLFSGLLCCRAQISARSTFQCCPACCSSWC